MNASKTLIASIAAAAIVGTVGFVSAQTNDTAAPPSGTSTNRINQPPVTDQSAMQAPMPANTSTDSSQRTQQPSTPSTDSSTVAPAADEPAPKADRN